MPFTLIVEDGTVIDDANSYASVAEADAYFLIDSNFAAPWDAYTDAEKEALLGWSTRILDQRVDWSGSKYDTESALRWPRINTYDADNVRVPYTVVPTAVKHALFELVKYSVTTDPTTTQEVTSISKLVADVVEIEYQPNTSQTTFPPIINQILGKLGRFRTGTVGFGRIVKA